MLPSSFSGWGIRTIATHRGALQPDELPQRLGLAARQRADRRRHGALRLPRRGGARSSGGCSTPRPTSTSSGCPSCSAASRGCAATGRPSIRSPARRRPGRRRRRSRCCAPASGSASIPRTATSSSTSRCCPISSTTSRCASSPSATTAHRRRSSTAPARRWRCTSWPAAAASARSPAAEPARRARGVSRHCHGVGRIGMLTGRTRRVLAWCPQLDGMSGPALMHRIARQMTLRQRLLAIVAVAIVPGVVGLAFLIAAGHRQREREVRDQALRTSQIVALEMERIVTGAEAVLQASRSARRSGVPGCRELSRGDRRGAAAALGLRRRRTGRDAHLRDRGDRGSGAEGAAVVRGGVRPPRPRGRHLHHGPGSPYLPVAISTEDARPRVLATAIDLAWLGARLRERKLAAGSVLTVADREGTLLAREPEPERFVGRQLAADFAPLLDADRPGTAELRSPDGTLRIVGYQPPAATGDRPLRRGGHLQGRGLRPDLRLDAAHGAAGRRRGGRRLPRRLAGRRPAVPPADPAHAGDDRELAGRRRDRAHRHRRRRAASSSELAAAIDGYMDEPRGGARPSAPPSRSGGRCCCGR